MTGLAGEAMRVSCLGVDGAVKVHDGEAAMPICIQMTASP